MYHKSTVCHNVHAILSPQPLKIKKISIDTLTKSVTKLSEVKTSQFSFVESDSYKCVFENSYAKDMFEEGSSYSNLSRDELVISRSENPLELDAKFIEFNNSLKECLEYDFYFSNEDANY